MKMLISVRSKGFTIVELLIVIVVIGILAAITIVAFNGVQARAQNMKIVSIMRSNVTVLRAYHAEKGYWPTPDASVTPQNGLEYCFGKNFEPVASGGGASDPSNRNTSPYRRCVDEYGSLRYESDWLSNELAPYGGVPEATSLLKAGTLFYHTPTYVSQSIYINKYSNSSTLTYPEGRNRTNSYMQFTIHPVNSCTIVPNAQQVGTFDGKNVCLLMLEYYE